MHIALMHSLIGNLIILQYTRILRPSSEVIEKSLFLHSLFTFIDMYGIQFFTNFL